LQAQLENPKLFKEAPFQSDQDLAMHQKQQEKKEKKLPEVRTQNQISAFVQRMVNTIARMFTVQNKRVSSTCTICSDAKKNRYCYHTMHSVK
jgi:hypothetical protein